MFQELDAVFYCYSNHTNICLQTSIKILVSRVKWRFFIIRFNSLFLIISWFSLYWSFFFHGRPDNFFFVWCNTYHQRRRLSRYWYQFCFAGRNIVDSSCLSNFQLLSHLHIILLWVRFNFFCIRSVKIQLSKNSEINMSIKIFIYCFFFFFFWNRIISIQNLWIDYTASLILD